MTRVHFIGICGTAMATLAAMLKRHGLDVRGSDQDVYPPMSEFLAAEGIPVSGGYHADHIHADIDLVVVVFPCVPATTIERAFHKKLSRIASGNEQ